MSLSIRYHAHHLELSGYGRAAAGYIQALRLAGASVEVVPVEGVTSSEEVDVAIYHSTPSRLKGVIRSPAKKQVAVTTWETEYLPEEFSETLYGFDSVIMPSEFCRQLIRVSSVKDEACLKEKIYVIPHGFDPSAWPLKVDSRTKPSITFYSIGAWGERKNTLGLLKAYLHAFRRSDRTNLILIVDKVNMTAVHSVLARSMIPQNELPGMYIPDHRLTDEDLIHLHQDADCFVSATRAEGFGLPLFEAAVMGKPIIAPMWGGQSEFLDGYGCKSVPYSMTPVFPGEDSLQIEGNRIRLETSLPSGANSSQIWAEPNLERLALFMRLANFDHLCGKLKDNHNRRNWFEENYSFDVIGKKFLEVLK